MLDYSWEVHSRNVRCVVIRSHARELLLLAVVGLRNEQVEHASEKQQPGQSAANRNGLPPLARVPK